MKWLVYLSLFLGFTYILKSAQLEIKDGDRVAFVGGTFFEREAEHGLIETYLTLANRDKDVKFRNLAWSADTVKGESRGYFKIEDGYGLLLQKVTDTKPSVIVLAYGANAAWSGETGLDTFIKDYQKLIKDLQSRNQAKIILMSTPRQENLGAPYPDPSEYNQNLASYFAAVAKLAKQEDLLFLDLFNELKDVSGLTSNSIHLNEAGYRRIAELLSGQKKSTSQVLKKTGLDEGKYDIHLEGENLLCLSAQELNQGYKLKYLNLNERRLQREIKQKNEQFFHYWRPQNTTYIFGFRKHEQGQNSKEFKNFATFIQQHEEKIAQLKQDADVNYKIVPQISSQVVEKKAKSDLILPPEEEIKTFNLPDDLELTLFAAEPWIINPTNMNWDAKGRLWVACTPGYPQIKPGHMASDQIVVLEDTNKDGKADKHHVFVDDVLIPTAVLPGNDGVYVANSTELVHYKDSDGDMKADVKKVIMSGFGTEDSHHIIHTPYWGQDGMLYFSQSIYIHSHVETPWGVERLMAGGVWQYNPQTERLKVYTRGLINPWGYTVDKYGQSFATDGAGAHGINYLFPGIAQVTAYGTRHLYPGLNPGQPKHCGLEIISGSHFPGKYQGLMVTNDFRGHRTNTFKLTENGSAFISNQQGDLLSTGSGKIDRHGKGGGFRPVDVRMGPDGALYIADWSNVIIQHGEVDFRDKRRDQSHGRIWRVSAKNKALKKVVDFTTLKTKELLNNLQSTDRYIADMSKRVLTERGYVAIEKDLQNFLKKDLSDYTELQVLWLLQGMNYEDNQLLLDVLSSDDYRIRAAAIRVASQQYLNEPRILKIFKVFIKDEAAIVRLETINALRNLKSTEAVELSLMAMDSEVDKTIDYALTLNVREMEDLWIGKTLFDGNIKRLTYAVNASRNPRALEALYRAYKAGKIAANCQSGVLRLIGELGDVKKLTELYDLSFSPELSIADKKVILSSLLATSQARGIKPKANFNRLAEFIKEEQLQDLCIKLIGEWQVKSLTKKLTIPAQQGNDNAFKALAKLKGPEAQKILLSVIDLNPGSDHAVRAIAALSTINMKIACDQSVKLFKNTNVGLDCGPIFTAVLKDQKGPKILEESLLGKSINSSIALLGVQRANMGGRDLSSLVVALNKAGDLKPMKQNLSSEELAALVKAVKDKGNPHLGENIYRKQSIACINCHAIGGAGPKIGPDLISIGASAPVDYLIESILQPSKKIKEGYHMTMVTTKEGQMIAGSQVSASKDEVVIRDALGNTSTIPTRNIKSKEFNPMSMMPPGLAASLSEEEFIHMIAFLSELGKDGDFKMSNKRYVRSFDVANEKVSKRNWDTIGSLNFRSALAKVDATIPLKDKSIFTQSSSVIKFDVDVIKEGLLTLKFSSLEGLQAFKITRERLEVDLEEKTASVKVNKGQTSILILLSKAFNEDDLRVEVFEDKTSAIIQL
ncbi:GDSL-type esterase/lipase family protein [Lentisphaera marina]|uniref:PVC-type heme-binding CxxCH protein n=1 Tax=Lentisphaera marina TaxID=1111041 RepID=UPI0023666C21|nr:PVC-type heme-binding CxxCH protein [Lentisphaera marina]MDD7984998.1 GDSL-type esterase/lipase family protein [Lentisphaera marina]